MFCLATTPKLTQLELYPSYCTQQWGSEEATVEAGCQEVGGRNLALEP